MNKTPHPNHGDMIHHICSTYEKHYKRKYDFKTGADGRAVRIVLKNWGYNESRARWDAYLDYDVRFTDNKTAEFIDKKHTILDFEHGYRKDWYRDLDWQSKLQKYETKNPKAQPLKLVFGMMPKSDQVIRNNKLLKERMG